MAMQVALRISDEDIARYQRDGAVLIKRALTGEALKLLEAGIEEAYRAPGRQTKLGSGMGDGRTAVLEYVSHNSPVLRSLLESGRIGQIGATLMRARSAQLVLDQIFYKADGPILPTPWHQDTPFLRVRGDEMIRIWMPCDPSPRDVTVQVVRGSHRWNVVYNALGAGAPAQVDPADLAKYNGIGDPTLPPPPDVAARRDSFDILSWDVEPGDALAFQGNMLHGADGHPGLGHPRRALAVMLGGPDLRYHAPRGKAFPVPGSRDRSIPHGAPIGDYESAFPVLWRA